MKYKFRKWFQQILINRWVDLKIMPKKPKHSLDTLLFAKENQPYLKLALNGLPPQQRAAIILHYQQKLPATQVAQALGISADGLDNLFINIRQHLATELKKSLPHRKLDLK